MTDFLPSIFASLGALAILIIGLEVTRGLTARSRKRILGSLENYAGPTKVELSSKGQNISIQDLVDRIGKVLVSGNYRKFIIARMDAAGNHEAVQVQGYITKKVYYLFAGLLLGLILLATSGVQMIFFTLLFPIVGFMLPDVLLYNEALKRQETLGKSLADAIDLLNMCVQSGLSFEAALQRVATSMSGPVAEDFGGLLGEMQLGKTRSEALAVLATRTTQPDFLRFITAMSQVDRLGVPVAAVLKEQAYDMRSKRRELAREMAQKVPIKILAPVMLCFLPSIFVIVVGPAAISIATGLSGL